MLSMLRMRLRCPRTTSTGARSTIVCGRESTAMTPNSSVGPSRSRTCAVPMLARSIFFFPPPAGADIEPERSSATTMANCNFRCSFRISIETGRMRSSGEPK